MFFFLINWYIKFFLLQIGHLSYKIFTTLSWFSIYFAKSVYELFNIEMIGQKVLMYIQT